MADASDPDFVPFTKGRPASWKTEGGVPTVTLDKHGNFRFGRGARRILRDEGAGHCDNSAERGDYELDYLNYHVDPERGLVGFHHFTHPDDGDMMNAYKPSESASASAAALLDSFDLDPPERSIMIRLRTDAEYPYVDLTDILDVEGDGEDGEGESA